jgi:hypothetical protein
VRDAVVRVRVLLMSFVSFGLRVSASDPLPVGETGVCKRKGASRGTGCTEPKPLGGGGGSWAETPCSALRGSAPKPGYSQGGPRLRREMLTLEPGHSIVMTTTLHCARVLTDGGRYA